MNSSARIEEIHFHLEITAEQLLEYYQGGVSQVQIRAIDGRIIQFPVSNIRPYITQSGIRGRFVLRFDVEKKKILSVMPLSGSRSS